MATSKTQYNSKQQQNVWSVLFAKQTNTNENSMDESARTLRDNNTVFRKLNGKYEPEAYWNQQHALNWFRFRSQFS